MTNFGNDAHQGGQAGAAFGAGLGVAAMAIFIALAIVLAGVLAAVMAVTAAIFMQIFNLLLGQQVKYGKAWLVSCKAIATFLCITALIITGITIADEAGANLDMPDLGWLSTNLESEDVSFAVMLFTLTIPGIFVAAFVYKNEFSEYCRGLIGYLTRCGLVSFPYYLALQ